MSLLDLVWIVLLLLICLVAAIQGLIRQLLSLGVLYIATVVAGLFYPQAAHFVTAIGGRTPTLTQAFMFWVLLLAITLGLEGLLRWGFPDTRLPSLKFLDNLLALAPGIIYGLILISLLLTSLGYATLQSWGQGLAFLREIAYQSYQTTAFRPLLEQVLSAYLSLHRIWFPTPPPLLAYLLP